MKQCPGCPGELKKSRDYDSNGQFIDVWKCDNCRYSTPVRAYSFRNEEMNPSQKAAVKYFRNRFFHIYGDFSNPEGETARYEYKRWEVDFRKDSGDVVITCTVGMKNDEGTAAEIICRKNGMIFIGRKGGFVSYRSGKRLIGKAAIDNCAI